MQKFREYIYVDDERIKSYISQIPEFHKIETTSSHEKSSAVNGGIDVKIAKLGSGVNERDTTVYTTSMNDLERMVTWSLSDANAIYFDSRTELENTDKDRIVVLTGIMKIPEMVESIEAIQSLRQNAELFSMVPNTDDEESQKILSYMKDSENIPILLETDSNYIVSCSIKRKLSKDSNDFLDNLDDSITIIGKIDRVYNNEDKVEIYDMSKEVLKLNRTIRRTIEKKNLEKMIVFEEGPVIKVIPIIIYR